MGIRQLIRRALGRPPAPAPASRAPAPSGEALPPRRLLEGQTAVVIGAGPNVGLGVAAALASEGARLLLTNASRAELDQVLGALGAQGFEPVGLDSDVTAAADTDALLAWLEREAWTPDILVLNVGVHARDGVESLEEIIRVLRTNVAGPLWLARRVARRMQDRATPGAIVYISSIHHHLWLGDANYSASKAGMVMAMRELALELAPAGIRVNGVAPGWVAGDAAGRPVPHRLTPLYQTSTPPSAIGQAVVFLANRALSGHTTGALLTVDGGASLASYATPPLPPLAPE